MEEFTREFLNQGGNENLSDEEFHLKLGEYMERRGRAAAPTAPNGDCSSPAQEVRSLLVMGVVRSWMRSRNVHHCRALSTLEWVGRTARHVLLSKMVPCTGDAVVLERVELPCTQRGNVHPRRTADTWYAASAAVLFLDAVVSFDGALRSGTAVERAGSPSWPTRWTAVGVVLAAVVAAVDIAAAAAAVQVTVAAGVAAMQAAGVAAMQMSVAAAMGVTAAAAMGLTAPAAAVVVHRDHRLGACPSACLSACLVHGYHLQSPLRRCLYMQRLAHVGKRSS